MIDPEALKLLEDMHKAGKPIWLNPLSMGKETNNDWDDGDEYIITNGYPGLDQIGWVGPTAFGGVQSTQVLDPWYAWGNNYNSETQADSLPFVVSFLDAGHTDIAQPQADIMIQENREFYNDTVKPGYTPFTYPHPLQSTATIVKTSQSAAAALLAQ